MERISSTCSKLGRLILLVFVFLLPLVILPGGMHKFAIAKLTLFRVTVIVLLVSWVAEIFFERKAELRRSPLDLPIIVFLAANALATAFSLSPSLSVMGAFFQRQEGLLTLFGYTVLFFATAHFLGGKGRVLTAIKVAAFSSILVSLYGLAQYFGYDIFSYGLVGLEKVRSFSTLGNSDLLGSYLVLILPLNLGLILTAQKAKEYVLGTVAFLSAALALIFSLTRGAWIGAFLGLAVMAFFALRIKGARKRMTLFLVMLALALGLVLAVNMVGSRKGYSLRDRISSLVSGGGTTGETRLLMWKDSLKVIRERPLWGWGPETFRDILPRYASIQLMRLEGKRIIERPHNQTLYMAASAGVLGVMGYLWLIAAFFLLGFMRRGNENGSFEVFKAAVLAGGLGYFVQEQFLFSFVSVTPLLWIILGFAVCLAQETDAEQLHISLNVPSRIRGTLILATVLLGFLAFAFSLIFMEADLEAGLGRDAIAAGNLQVAASSLQRAIAFNPWEPRYRYYLGAVYNDLGTQTKEVSWLEQAGGVYQAGLRQNRYDYTLWQGLGDSIYQISQVRKGYGLNLALSAYENALELNPFWAETHLRLGTILSLQKEWERSLSQFEAALSMSPNNVEALDGIAEVYEKKGELSQSQGYFERALAVDSFDRVAREGIKRLKAKMLSIPRQ